MTVVALSAAYGAGGSQIGPALADRLGVPFVDRAIPLEEAEEARRGVDRAQAAHWSRFYGADISDPSLYHLVLDRRRSNWTRVSSSWRSGRDRFRT